MNFQSCFDSLPAENPIEIQQLQVHRWASRKDFEMGGLKNVNLQSCFDSMPAENPKEIQKVQENF